MIFINTKSLWDRLCLPLSLGVIWRRRKPKISGTSYDSEILNKVSESRINMQRSKMLDKVFLFFFFYTVNFSHGSYWVCYFVLSLHNDSWINLLDGEHRNFCRWRKHFSWPIDLKRKWFVSVQMHLEEKGQRNELEVSQYNHKWII